MARGISSQERERLQRWIQYLNLEEMRGFCTAHGLPLYIHVERPGGGLRKTGDRDRKDVVLGRILEYALHRRRSGTTVYSESVVSDVPLPHRLTGRVRLHYGQYDKKNEKLMHVLRELTRGSFKDSMIARLALRDFWTAGTAPTLRQLADEYVRAKKAHTEPRPEGAYLVDLSKGSAGDDWKKVRVENARRALSILDRLIDQGQ